MRFTALRACDGTQASSAVLITVDGGTSGSRLLSRLRVVCGERIVIIWVWDVTASWLCWAVVCQFNPSQPLMREKHRGVRGGGETKTARGTLRFSVLDPGHLLPSMSYLHKLATTSVNYQTSSGLQNQYLERRNIMLWWFLPFPQKVEVSLQSWQDGFFSDPKRFPCPRQQLHHPGKSEGWSWAFSTHTLERGSHCVELARKKNVFGIWWYFFSLWKRNGDVENYTCSLFVFFFPLLLFCDCFIKNALAVPGTRTWRFPCWHWFLKRNCVLIIRVSYGCDQRAELRLFCTSNKPFLYSDCKK